MQTKTSYRPNHKSTLSPFHKQMQDKSFDYSNPKNPVHQEIKKNVGTFNFTATIEQDTQTLNRFKHIKGLIAFLCTLKRDGKVIGEGRGSATLNQMNKFIERTIRYAFNASLIDAIVRSVKSLDTLTIEPNKLQATPFSVKDLDKKETTEMITDNQKRYLTELVYTNVTDDESIAKWENNLRDFTKVEASEAIQNFKN